MKDVRSILDLFDLKGAIGNIEPFGTGHINDTFRVENLDDDHPDYLLQKVNHHVFKDVPGMMQNISLITGYLKDKYREEGKSNIDERVLSLINTKDGQPFVRYKDGYWRVFVFIKTLKSLDVPESSEQIYEGAKAFGHFIADLDAFDASGLTYTIPYFHHLPRRIKQLDQALERNNGSLSDEEHQAVKFALDHADKLSYLQKQIDRGKLPLRVTHNDTKFNNVLLDQHNHAKCVIDLDTVMPGIVHFDYGDGIRTGTSFSAEDETNLDLVDVDLIRFEAFTSGFMEPLKDILTEAESSSLILSAELFPFLMGVRFLTDHLSGNVYYKVKYQEHNLDRARNQLWLCHQMMRRRTDLTKIVKKYI